MNLDHLTANAIAGELGARIKTARLNANLTQKALAKKAGISLKAVTNGEKGKERKRATSRSKNSAQTKVTAKW